MHTQEKMPSPTATFFANRRVELERIEAQLAEWTALIDQYRASARRVATPSRVELEAITDELQLRRNEAGAQVMRLKRSDDAEWEHEKAMLEQSWQAIRSSFLKAHLRF